MASIVSADNFDDEESLCEGGGAAKKRRTQPILKEVFPSSTFIKVTPLSVSSDIDDLIISPPKPKKLRSETLEKEDQTAEYLDSFDFNFTEVIGNFTGDEAFGAVGDATLTSHTHDIAVETASNVSTLDSFSYEEFISIKDTSAPSNELLFSVDRPFRADVNGKSIIVGLDNDPSSMTFDAFFDHLLVLTGQSSIFVLAEQCTTPRIFKGNNLKILVDQEFHKDIPIPSKYPIHPLFRIAREIFVQSIFSNNISRVKDFIEAGMNVSFDIYFSGTFIRFNCLHYALQWVKNVSAEIVELLLKAGIDPNEFDSEGYTALHHCAHLNNTDILMLLIEFGANPNILSNRHNCMAPIHFYALCKKHLILNILVYTMNVDINLLDFCGRHLIHFAIFDHNLTMFSDLLARPDIHLDFNVVFHAFTYIHSKVTESDQKSLFYSRLIHHLNTRKVSDSHSY